MTQEELATKVGTKQTIIWRWENNVVDNISTNKLLALASALDTTPEYIQTGNSVIHEQLPDWAVDWLTNVENKEIVLEFIKSNLK
jgi:transcriptional regulator with XRE-family HTH domain